MITGKVDKVAWHHRIVDVHILIQVFPLVLLSLLAVYYKDCNLCTHSVYHLEIDTVCMLVPTIYRSPALQYISTIQQHHDYTIEECL